MSNARTIIAMPFILLLVIFFVIAAFFGFVADWIMGRQVSKFLFS